MGNQFSTLQRYLRTTHPHPLQLVQTTQDFLEPFRLFHNYLIISVCAFSRKVRVLSNLQKYLALAIVCLKRKPLIVSDGSV